MSNDNRISNRDLLQKGLVGDYRFHIKFPFDNTVKGRLPSMRTGWGEDEMKETAHGVDLSAGILNPLLYGLVPEGGRGEGEANNWALAWTLRVKAYIPEHPDLNLGEKFTIWCRFYFAGTPSEEQADFNVRMITRWQSPPDRGYILWCSPPGIITLTAAFNDVTANWRATDQSMILNNVGWYDVAVVYDGNKLYIYNTPIGTEGPMKTSVQSFAHDPFPRSRLRLLKSAVNETGGDLRVMQYGGMIEHLLLYRNCALDEKQISNLSSGVYVPDAYKIPEVDVNKKKQLFIDDAIISKLHSVKRHWYTAVKHESNFLMSDEAMDDKDYIGPSIHLSIIYDDTERVFRMWYHYHKKTNELYCCHITSSDGLNWERLPFKRGISDNVHIDNPRSEIMRNLKVVWKNSEEPDSQQRFKAFAYPMDFYTSPDGLNWNNRGKATDGADDASMAAWLPIRKKYLFSIRPLITGKPPGYRTQALFVSKSPLNNNIPMKLVLTPDKIDLSDDPHLQFYHMPVYEYCGWLISPVSVYHSDDATDGRTGTQWAFSRDGLNWLRPSDRCAAIALGEPGDWDSGSIYAASTMVEVDDEIRIYYNGTENRHFELNPNCSGIGLARLRRDGFVSLNAGSDEGTILTKTFKLQGESLEINAVSRGYIKVLILDAVNAVKLAESHPFIGDSCRHALTWKELPNLESLKSREVCIEFLLKDAKIYSFQII